MGRLLPLQKFIKVISSFETIAYDKEIIMKTKIQKNRVELFINGEYRGIYSLGYVQKENKELNN